MPTTGVSVFRLEQEYVLGEVAAYEGLWIAVDTPPDTSAAFDVMQGIVDGWYSSPPPGFDKARSDLMGQEVLLNRHRLLQFALEFFQIESELVSAVIGLPSTSDSAALPSSVSKEIRLHPAQGGRGNYARIHTCGHPQFAMHETTPNRMSDDYAANLFACYQFLLDLFAESPIWSSGLPPHTVHHFPVVGVVHRQPHAGAEATYTFTAGAELRMSGSKWGTMRIRGPGEIRTGGRHSLAAA